LGRYQLLAAVGEGGMGRVWAARQVGSPLQRLVAVKTAISGQSQTPEFQRLFMDEARIASLIHHPHVCGVYELGEENGTLYLVMEWCDGASLRQVMDKLPDGRMDMAVAARIIANVASGLHAAHELEDSDGTKLRVVHRDVSPQNILISKNGHIKVADFGVAKAQGQLHRPTETGEMKGKLAYMAPEQVTAKDIDHRADIFALGCVLYEVTVGRRPFQGEGALSTLYQLLEQAVAAPGEVLPGYPAELSAIVLKALAKDANQRYQTAEDLRIALESWIASTGSNASEREIHALLRATVSDEVDQKSRSINEAAARLKERRSDLPDASRDSSDPTSPTDTATRSRDGASTVDRGVATGGVREKSSSWWLPVGAGLAVLGLVVVLAKGTLGTVQPEPVAPSNAPVPSAIVPVATADVTPAPTPPVTEVAPAPSKGVLITMRTIPSNATISIDDGEAVDAPYTLETQPSAELRTIRASAPNHTSVTRKVIFDQTREIVLELGPAPGGRKGKPRGKTDGTQTTPSPSVDMTLVKPREPGVLPSKRPRALDEDNPFAG
jgi:eukaryotic-like serine/threonine-protein kinase